MKKTDRFADLAAVRAEHRRLLDQRGRHAAALEEHWGLLHEAGFRHGLARDAVSDLFGAWKPMRTLAALMGQGNGVTDGAVGLLAGSRAGTVKGRIGGWLIGTVASALLRHLVPPDRMEHIAREVGLSWRRVKERMRQGRTEREEQH